MIVAVEESLFGRSQADVEAALPAREPVDCPLCHRPPCRFGVDFQGFHLARCPTCGLQFQHPRPVFGQLVKAVYGDVYHPPDDASVATRRHGLERQLDRLQAMLAAPCRAMLDVGCGAGAFIRLASARGWQVDGTDVVVTDWARQTGARLWEGQLPDIEFGTARFDVVRFNHVLEHTLYPLDELRRAREVVTKRGLLLVGVPNLVSLTNSLKTWQSRLHLKIKRWRHYGALHHLWFFTPSTLCRLVETAGFDVVHWGTPVPERSGLLDRWVTSLVRRPVEALCRGDVIELYARAR